MSPSMLQRFGGVPHCPLCGKLMLRGKDKKRKIDIFFCMLPACNIFCSVNDPFVGRWEEALHKSTDGKGIECPRSGCDGKMKYFATYIGYMKAVCPKCKAAVSNMEADRKKGDKTYTPDDRSPVQ